MFDHAWIETGVFLLDSVFLRYMFIPTFASAISIGNESCLLAIFLFIILAGLEIRKSDFSTDIWDRASFRMPKSIPFGKLKDRERGEDS